MTTIPLTETSIDELLALWAEPQTEPREPLLWRTKLVDDQTLRSFEQIHDLLESLGPDEWVTVYPPRGGWYTQAWCWEQGTFEVECAFETTGGGAVNWSFVNPDGSALRLAVAYAVMAQFARTRELPGGYRADVKVYGDVEPRPGEEPPF